MTQKKETLRLEELRRIAEAHGGQLLSTEWKGDAEKYRFAFADGREFSMMPGECWPKTGTEKEWNRYATNLLKSELARAGIGYDELIQRLDAIGVQESYKGLAAKINRGTYSLVFFAQCMKALAVKSVRLGE